MVLPEFNLDGDLPAGVHFTSLQEFRARFGPLTPRRVWLAKRLEALVELAAKSVKLRRVFVWVASLRRSRAREIFRFF
jgi:hypothetical protein